jgi:hypothetical protein
VDDVELEGEEDDEESDAESNPDIPIIPGNPIDAPNLLNQPVPIPPAAPVANEGLRHSNRNRKPSQLVKDILNKTGVTSNKPSDIRKGLVTGIQPPTADDAVTAEDLDKEDDGGDEAADNELVEEIGGAAMAAAMAQISGLEPRNLKEAMEGPEWPKWQEAIVTEHKALEAFGTWVVEKPPLGASIIGSTWVFKRKLDANGATS